MSQFKYAPGKFETVLLFTALMYFVTRVVDSRCFVAGMKQLSEFNHYFGACDSTGQGWYEGILSHGCLQEFSHLPKPGFQLVEFLCGSCVK